MLALVQKEVKLNRLKLGFSGINKVNSLRLVEASSAAPLPEVAPYFK